MEDIKEILTNIKAKTPMLLTGDYAIILKNNYKDITKISSKEDLGRLQLKQIYVIIPTNLDNYLDEFTNFINKNNVIVLIDEDNNKYDYMFKYIYRCNKDLARNILYTPNEVVEMLKEVRDVDKNLFYTTKSPSMKYLLRRLKKNNSRFIQLVGDKLW